MCPLCRLIVRVLVTDDDLSREVIDPLEGLYCTFKIFKGFYRVQISYMRTENNFVVKDKCDRIFLIGTDSQYLFLLLKGRVMLLGVKPLAIRKTTVLSAATCITLSSFVLMISLS